MSAINAIRSAPYFLYTQKLFIVDFLQKSLIAPTRSSKSADVRQRGAQFGPHRSPLTAQVSTAFCATPRGEIVLSKLFYGLQILMNRPCRASMSSWKTKRPWFCKLSWRLGLKEGEIYRLAEADHVNHEPLPEDFRGSEPWQMTPLRRMRRPVFPRCAVRRRRPKNGDCLR